MWDGVGHSQELSPILSLGIPAIDFVNNAPVLALGIVRQGHGGWRARTGQPPHDGVGGGVDLRLGALRADMAAIHADAPLGPAVTVRDAHELEVRGPGNLDGSGSR
jgi:hypothetical protein